MFTANVYRIMVGSLSGAMEEVYVAKETIRKWNQQNAERTGKVFMPIEWSTSPEAIQNTDIVVGIVDNWIDDTKFVEDCVEAGKQVILFFKAIHDPANTIYGEQKFVKAFENKIKGRCSCSVFNGIEDIIRSLIEQIEAL